MFGHKLTNFNPFNRKIDNFSDLEEIENIVYVSIDDEDIIKKQRSVGVLQISNKFGSDIF